MTLTLQIKERDEKNTAKTLRDQGILPGVVYGPKQEAVSVSCDQKEFDKVFAESGESTIITLNGLTEDVEVLVQEVSFDSTKGGVTHVDFYAIERGKEMTTNVPINFVGEAPAEKQGASVNKVLHEVEVTCRPSALPSHIDVSLDGLIDTTSIITVADLPTLDGVTYGNDPEDAVATVAAAREEEPETVEAEATDMSEVEVEQKGKAPEGETAQEEA